jgi:hypothetical protein
MTPPQLTTPLPSYFAPIHSFKTVGTHVVFADSESNFLTDTCYHAFHLSYDDLTDSLNAISLFQVLCDDIPLPPNITSMLMMLLQQPTCAI